MDVLAQLFTDYTLRNVALGAATLGLVSGALGSFAVLRRQSLLGDAISHAALPGIALAYLLTGTKASLILMLGAGLAGWLGTLLVMAITQMTRIKYDSALGLILSVFFGFGLMLLTFLQRQPDANQAGLETFLWGQAAALVQRDVVTMLVVGALTLVCLALAWKEFKLLAFDAEFGRSLGFRMRWVDIALTTLLVIAIVLGLQTVGVVLMSAILIAPAAAARQWTDRLGMMVLIAAVFGATAGVSGAWLSSATTGLPTGPTIVLCASVLFVVSMLLAPNRGLVWRRWRHWRNSRQLRRDAILLDLYALARQHAERHHPHDKAVLDVMNPADVDTRRILDVLAAQELVEQVDDRRWALTTVGRIRAETLLQSAQPSAIAHDAQAALPTANSQQPTTRGTKRPGREG